MNTRQVGMEKEKQACEYLKAQGMIILEQNFRNRQGEVDIIGSHEGYLVFVEVKFRKNDCCGTALAAVSLSKQRQICKTADAYRYVHHYGENTAVRYDVLAIQGNHVEWLQNAFSHIYTRNF